MNKKMMSLVCGLAVLAGASFAQDESGTARPTRPTVKSIRKIQASQQLPANAPDSATRAETQNGTATETNATTVATKPSRRPRKMPPEAFVRPDTYLLLVNHNGAVDSEWLAEQAKFMEEQLSVVVKTEELGGAIGGAVKVIRGFENGENAKIIIILSEEEGIPAILTSPYEYWAIMDAGWVKKGGGDTETLNTRMGKRIFQALGHCIGAGHRVEREAVMRFTPTPTDLDDCLSRGFHPLNSNIFMIVQKHIGLERIRLRPVAELIEMGIIEPRK